MANSTKFGLLSKILRAIGLSEAAINDLLDWIAVRLNDEQQETNDDAAAPIFPYLKRDDFLSPAELSFYQVLRNVAGTRFLICPKVSLADLFFVKSGDSRVYRTYTNKIDRKHVDFVLCNPETMIPLAGIELDDKSHARADRRRRDSFVDSVFAAAGLKLLRVRVQHGYQAQELADLLESVSIETIMTRSYITASHRKPPKEPSPTNDHNCDKEASVELSSPLCPKCGEEMILRTAKKGSNRGQQFWGCSNFPRCRMIIPFERTTVGG